MPLLDAELVVVWAEVVVCGVVVVCADVVVGAALEVIVCPVPEPIAREPLLEAPVAASLRASLLWLLGVA